MASGNTLAVFGANQNQPPSTGFAYYGRVNNHPILVFDATSDTVAVFADLLSRTYAAGGITLTLIWCADTATSGNVVWTAAFERDNGGSSITSDSFATAQSATEAVPGTSKTLVYTTITFANGDIDGLLAGEAFRLKITRDADHASDTATGNVFLLRVELKET